jgi:acetyl-CoA carboxylase carboxyltransferase component
MSTAKLPLSASRHPLTPRERIGALCDPGTFCELFPHTTPTIITGTGDVDGRPIALLAYDPEAAPAWSTLMVEKIVRLQELAGRQRCPLVLLVDKSSPQTRNGRFVFAQREGMGRTYFHHARLSGKVPQVALLFGPASSVKAFPPALCDTLVMVKGTTLTLSPAEVTGHMTGEKCSLDALGSAEMHCQITGTSDALADTDADAIAWARRYLAYMPTSAAERPPLVAGKLPDPSAPALGEVVPKDPNRPFPMIDFVRGLVDAGSILELKASYAPELITTFARIDGIGVGILANNSAFRGGILRAESCDKAVRFIQLCDAFHIPLLYLSDVPGFMVGQQAEKSGIVREAAKFFVASATASVPKISVVVRKVHTAGLYAMCGPAFEPDVFLALPDTQLSLIGPKYVDETVKNDKTLHSLTGADRDRHERELRLSYLSHSDPRKLAREIVVDAVVPPHELRATLAIRFLRLVRTKPVDISGPGSPIWPM